MCVCVCVHYIYIYKYIYIYIGEDCGQETCRRGAAAGSGAASSGGGRGCGCGNFQKYSVLGIYIVNNFERELTFKKKFKILRIFFFA